KYIKTYNKLRGFTRDDDDYVKTLSSDSARNLYNKLYEALSEFVRVDTDWLDSEDENVLLLLDFASDEGILDQAILDIESSDDDEEDTEDEAEDDNEEVDEVDDDEEDADVDDSDDSADEVDDDAE